MSSQSRHRLLRARAVAFLLGISPALLAASMARAEVSISDGPTENMSCSAGVCMPTNDKAVLNAGDLANMLAGGDVTVATGTIAKEIALEAPLSWASASRLTLDARQSVVIERPMTVAGTGGLTITTNDGRKNGEFLIAGKGGVQFWDLSSSLVINGKACTLVGDVKTLAADIAANPAGSYALAKDYDASADGTYSESAVPTTFEGTFEGLGNTISNFKMLFNSGVVHIFGFFQDIGVHGIVRDLGVADANIAGGGTPPFIGALAGTSEGWIESCWATGSITQRESSVSLGGLVAINNGGTILRSSANVKVHGQDVNGLGGLVGGNGGIIRQSYASGGIKGAHGHGSGGGLVGANDEGQIVDSYSVNNLHDGRENCCAYGGLVGTNENGGTITNAYAAGKIRRDASSQSLLGGLVGDDEMPPGSIANGYWDLDKGVGDPSQGAGNIANDSGITGLTSQQLQQGLPPGFDPKVWAQSPGKNQGFPYLKDLPAK